MLRGLAVVHPLPSAINAALVAGLAVAAGGDALLAGVLGAAMLGYQASIGALNDVVDADRDRLVKPAAPIPAGAVSRRTALGIVAVGGALGSVFSAGFGLVVLLVGTAGYASGLAYDLFMRRHGWGWLCFSVAFPLLLAWTWLAAAGRLPPAWPVLLPLAALAGPAIHLANSLVDIEADRRAGMVSLATKLGFERARIVLAVLVALIYLLGWSALISMAGPTLPAALGALGATILAGLGVLLSWQSDVRAREAGWLLQAVGLAILAMAWVSSAADMLQADMAVGWQ
jgi:4-hydroxybenzoate polyprenyltransferase